MKKLEAKVIFLGNKGVGKTHMLQKFVLNIDKSPDNNIGDSFFSKEV